MLRNRKRLRTLKKGMPVNKLAPLCVLLAVLTWSVAGCSPQPPAPPKTQAAHDHDHGHAHEHGAHGPHDGDLVELGGGKYHAEIVHDDATKLVTIYLLGGDVKTPVTIAEESLVVSAIVDGKPQRFELPSKPQESDAEGQTSRFEATDAALIAAIDNPANKPSLSVTIEGRPYAGSITTHHHDHDHAPK